jgi:DNA-binding PucR family transcriptional regulator
MDVERLLRELAGSRYLAHFRKLVEPLLAYHRERRSDLVRTLRVYFAAGTNANEAADRHFLHRNSMLYPLTRSEAGWFRLEGARDEADPPARVVGLQR